MPTLLALETSCDESAAAVVRDQRVLASAVATQIEEHARWGGVVPEIASRRHVEALPGLIERVLAESGVAMAELDAIARAPLAARRTSPMHIREISSVARAIVALLLISTLASDVARASAPAEASAKKPPVPMVVPPDINGFKMIIAPPQDPAPVP